MWFHISWIFAPKASLGGFWIVLVGLVGPNSYGGGMDPSGTFHRLGWQAWNGKTPNLVHCVRAFGNLDLGFGLGTSLAPKRT